MCLFVQLAATNWPGCATVVAQEPDKQAHVKVPAATFVGSGFGDESLASSVPAFECESRVLRVQPGRKFAPILALHSRRKP